MNHEYNIRLTSFFKNRKSLFLKTYNYFLIHYEDIKRKDSLVYLKKGDFKGDCV